MCNENVKITHSIMANVNSGQDVANKRERKWWPNLIQIKQAVGMRRYGSLININPSGSSREESIFHASLKKKLVGFKVGPKVAKSVSYSKKSFLRLLFYQTQQERRLMNVSIEKKSFPLSIHVYRGGGGRGIPPKKFPKSWIVYLITAGFFLIFFYSPLPPAKNPCTFMHLSVYKSVCFEENSFALNVNITAAHKVKRQEPLFRRQVLLSITTRSTSPTTFSWIEVLLSHIINGFLQLAMPFCAWKLRAGK